MHKNSLDAFAALHINKREWEVMSALQIIGAPASDRHIALTMGSKDPNVARPRITELIKRYVLRETGVTKEGRRNVRMVWFVK